MESQINDILKREDLFELVWKEPATRLAERFNVPYSDFKKLCDEFVIPLPGSGYWSKLRAGKPVPNPVLPKDYTGSQEITIEPKAKTLGENTFLQTGLAKPVEQKVNKLFKVPAKLINPDMLIVAAKEQLEKDNPGFFDGLVDTRSGAISIKVSPKNVSRALRFMDTLIKALKGRGNSIRVNHGTTYAVVEGEDIEISLREKLNRTMVKGKHWDTATYTPSGIMIFKMDRIWAKEWKDGKYQLEEYLPDIIERLEQKGKQEKEGRIRRQKEEEERQERMRIQRALEARQEKELARFKTLLNDAKRWKEVKILREYIADMGLESSIKYSDPEAHEAWLKWAEQKADWYDPQINSQDELLDAVDKETLNLPKKTGYYW